MSIDSLAEEVATELADPRFANRSHYHRKTYEVGCRGPLCEQAASERQLAYRLRVQPPNRPNARTLRRLERLPELASIAAQHGITVNLPILTVSNN